MNEQRTENTSSWTEISVQYAKRSAKGNVITPWHPVELRAVKIKPTTKSMESQIQPQVLAIKQQHLSPHDLTPSPQSLSPNNYQNHRISPNYNVTHQQTLQPAPISTVRFGIDEQYLPNNNLNHMEYNNAMQYCINNNNNNQDNSDLNQMLPNKFQLNTNVNKSNSNSNDTHVMTNLLPVLNRDDDSVEGSVPYQINWSLTQASTIAAPYNHLEANIGQENVNVSRHHNNIDLNNSHSQHEHGLTNLLNIDSAELVRIDSKDQDIIHLNTEDLQISNLSISS